MSRCLLLLLLLTLAPVLALYKCGEDKTCTGKDQCCNSHSFFNVCCPLKSTCCANKNKAKCCGPLDICCSNPSYRGIACCPRNYRCCGAGRYGGLRNTCCYQVPLWLWIIMGLSLSLILLMLLLSLVECILEERANNDTSSRRASYEGSYYGTQYHDYGTYPSYGSGNLYNDPVQQYPAYTTPPPGYSGTPPPGYEEGSAGEEQGGTGNGNPGPRQRNGGSSAVDESPRQQAIREEEEEAEEGETVVEAVEVETPLTQECECETSQTQGFEQEEREVHSPMGNMWERYLRRSLKRKGKKKKVREEEETEESLTATPDLLGASSSRVTVDSGIVESDSSDEISSIHWSSWEDEKDLAIGTDQVRDRKRQTGDHRGCKDRETKWLFSKDRFRNKQRYGGIAEVVYELKPLDSAAAVPRLQKIIDKETNKRTDSSVDP